MDSTTAPGVLILFTRTPEAGHTKTRLIPALGADKATELHRKLLAHTVSVACDSGFTHVEIHAHPRTGHPFLQELTTGTRITMVKQTGADLGGRMMNALTAALSRHAFAVLVGCDCPLLDSTILDDAQAILERGGADVVLGPGQDGGYYLVGMRQVEPALFRDMPWGTANVLRLTRDRLIARNLTWRETRELWDVDVPADLGKLGSLPGYRDFCQSPEFDG